MKKFVALFLVAVLALNLLTGCAGTEKNDDENTLTINFGIRNAERFIEGLTAQFPDIRFEIEPTYCMNQSEYLRKLLASGNASDIYYSTQRVDAADAAENLLDLSGYDFISNFDRSVINAYVVDGRVYSIPGPMAIRGMAYNKTLFEEHGWSKPNNHRELVELCRQIREETDDITPIAMSLGGVGYAFTLVTTLSQAGFLGTPDGEAWESRFQAGEASIADGWGEGLEMTAELIDAGAFHPEPYVGVWDGSACRMEFAEGKAAMFAMWGGQGEILQMIEHNTSYEYAFMPFYGKEDGEMIICANPNNTWGISKRLAESGNEKKLENALRVMEWLCTPEAMELMKSVVEDKDGNLVPSEAELSPLNMSHADTSSSRYFVELWDLASHGNKMPMIYTGYESVIVNAGTIVQEAMLAHTSEGMIERFVSSVDSDYRDYLLGGKTNAIGEVERDMSEDETAQLLANVLNETGLGDFALVTHAGRAGKGLDNRRGAAVRLLAGTLTNANYNFILCDNKPLQTLTLTGAKVKELLRDGKKIVSSYDDSQCAYFPYFWAGIDVTQTKDGVIESVKLQGKELEDEREYAVVFFSGDYEEALGAIGNPVDSETLPADSWADYLALYSPIAAPEVLRQ